ncbi:MAG: 5-(carboxyamino)imidazole ribonucleotide synthase [Chloroflexota bacterium]|nr:5-(carboxyamino)imidazole ribonucleotide synthase [Chloroflexota bacterium]
MKKKSVGILGGGQLCQMLAESLIKDNKTVYFIDPAPSPPAKFTKSIHIQKDYEDRSALDILINNCDVITYEFENIPLKCLDYLDGKIQIFPSKFILSISQNRLNEKNNFIECNINTPKFIRYSKKLDLKKELKSSNINLPVIIKTNTLGYDGKGQFHLDSLDKIIEISKKLDTKTDYIIEEKIKFKKEFSIIIGRNKLKEIFYFDPIENIHKNGILDISISPARLDESVKKEAINLAKKFINKINLTGIIAIEMFLDENNNILFNEIAPRPHNSGHLTRDAHSISQFSVLGSILTEKKFEAPKIKKQAIMKNILGDFFEKKDYEKIIEEISKLPDHFVKMYNKEQAKPGRKMGHITIITKDIENSIVKINELID